MISLSANAPSPERSLLAVSSLEPSQIGDVVLKTSKALDPRRVALTFDQMPRSVAVALGPGLL